MAKIHWTQVERSALVQAMVSDILVHPYPLTSAELLRKAQEKAIAPGRRRKLVGNALHSLRALVAQAREEAVRAMQTRESKEPPAPIIREGDILAKHIQEVLERLSDVIAERTAEKVLAAIERETLPETDREEFRRNFLERTRAELSGSCEPRPGILVIGLLPSQHRFVRQDHPRADITFLTADEATRRDVVRRAHTVVMTKFISHSVQEKYRKVPNLQYCNGGVHDVSAIIESIMATA